MTTKERLKQYIEKDEIYQNYKQNKLMNSNDFDKFCIQHCKDIEELLEENQELKKQLKPDYYTKGLEGTLKEYQEIMTKFYTQQKEFIKYLEDGIENEKYCYLASSPIDRCRKDIYEEILQKYKEIIGVSDENNKQ